MQIDDLYVQLNLSIFVSGDQEYSNEIWILNISERDVE